MKIIKKKINITLTKAVMIALLGLGFTTAYAQEQTGNEVFTSVEHAAEFKGGTKALYTYMAQNIHYPADARQHKVQGKVIVTFIVEKDGSLSHVKVLRGIGSGCDEEAARVLQASPNWSPGTQNGKVVRQQYTVPVNFTLADK